MKNIVLTGLPGSGKSTLGEMAAAELRMNFIDLDVFIEKKQGIAIKDIFAQHGESVFRDMEASALAECLQGEGFLIASGGGIVLRPENRKQLKDKSLVVFIDRPLEKIMTNLEGNHQRPLLAAGLNRLHDLDSQRRHLYVETADLIWKNVYEDASAALPFLLSHINAHWVDAAYAVIGNPIGHSLSPLIHTAVFKALGLDEQYYTINVSLEDLPCFVKKVRQGGIKGFNATIPLKTALPDLIDEVDEEARLCGAVNTVVKRDGRLYGFNTDMDGLFFSLHARGFGFSGRNIVLLGAGGVAASVALKAVREKAAKVSILARQKSKAEAALSGAAMVCACTTLLSGEMSSENIAAVLDDCDLLINCTPLGMHGWSQNFEDLSFLKHLPAGSLVCDLIYRPAKTKFLKHAEELGLSILNGLGMLIYQAIIADEIFLNKKLDRESLYKIAASALEADRG